VITEKILSIYDAGDQLHKAMSAKIKIANGAEILFEPGETLTAIDVDQAGADGSAFVINRSVLPEIARQISLRNVGGLIVIDFLKMTREEDRNAILEELRRSCATDSLAPRILGFTAAGLCEITRPRRGQRLSIEDILE
jgi:Rne/Rng family ribonuclease